MHFMLYNLSGHIVCAQIIQKEGNVMADMGTKEAAELWGVSQRKVQEYCRKTEDKRIIQDKKGSPYHIPKDFPNLFN